MKMKDDARYLYQMVSTKDATETGKSKDGSGNKVKDSHGTQCAALAAARSNSQLSGDEEDGFDTWRGAA